MDKLLGSVNYIISMAANGEDPMTCPEEAPHSCSGRAAHHAAAVTKTVSKNE